MCPGAIQSKMGENKSDAAAAGQPLQQQQQQKEDQPTINIFTEGKVRQPPSTTQSTRHRRDTISQKKGNKSENLILKTFFPRLILRKKCIQRFSSRFIF